MTIRGACLMSFLIVCFYTANAQAEDKASRTVLFDASSSQHWSFPHDRNLDRYKVIPGKYLADAFQEKSIGLKWVSFGEKLSPEQLKLGSCLIRPLGTPTSDEDIAIYDRAIAAGSHLLLLSEGSANDPLLKHFGFELAESKEIGGLHYVKHAMAEKFSDDLGPWFSLSKQPKEAIALSKIRSGHSIAAYHLVKQGSVTVVCLPMQKPEHIKRNWNQLQSATAKLVAIVNTLLTTSSETLMKDLGNAPLVSVALATPSPVLTSPADQTQLAQDKKNWEFAWEPSPGATEYELIVYGATATRFLVDIQTKLTKEVYLMKGTIHQPFRLNWSWTVRSKNSAGEWGDWAIPRKFDVE